jgi:hypothetical protein
MFLLFLNLHICLVTNYVDFVSMEKYIVYKHFHHMNNGNILYDIHKSIFKKFFFFTCTLRS